MADHNPADALHDELEQEQPIPEQTQKDQRDRALMLYGQLKQIHVGLRELGNTTQFHYFRQDFGMLAAEETHDVFADHLADARASVARLQDLATEIVNIIEKGNI